MLEIYSKTPGYCVVLATSSHGQGYGFDDLKELREIGGLEGLEFWYMRDEDNLFCITGSLAKGTLTQAQVDRAKEILKAHVEEREVIVRWEESRS